MVLDARDEIGRHVCLKYVTKRTQEVDVARYLSSDELRRNTENHCVAIYDYFQDPFNPEVDYLVMPVLRPFNDPDFWAVGEVVDFATQILEVSLLRPMCICYLIYLTRVWYSCIPTVLHTGMTHLYLRDATSHITRSEISPVLT